MKKRRMQYGANSCSEPNLSHSYRETRKKSTSTRLALYRGRIACSFFLRPHSLAIARVECSNYDPHRKAVEKMADLLRGGASHSNPGRRLCDECTLRGTLSTVLP